MNEVISKDDILNKIHIIRERKVILDRDLAELYGVETGQLKRQVKRNIERFPDDFMFEFTIEEYRDFLRCHFGILGQGGHSKYPPMAFTEQGVAMLSSVLNSSRAIQVNIQIMRIFTNIREMLCSHDELKSKIEQLESKYDEQFRIVFDAIKLLLKEEEKKTGEIGFRVKDK